MAVADVLGIDWGQVATWGLSGLAFGTFVAVTLYLAMRALAFEVLASPVVQAIGSAAAQVFPKGGAKGKDWKAIAAEKGFELLGGWFGGRK